MSTENDVARSLRSWMKENRHEDADRVLDVVFDQIPATPQRRAGWLARRFPPMSSNAVRVGIAATVVVIAAILGFTYLNNEVGTDSPTPTPTASPTATPARSPTPSTLPALRLPGMGPGASAGDYGWSGGPGSVGWLHHVIGEGDTLRQTQIAFSVQDDCFAAGEGPAPLPLTIAGYDALQVEPYPDEYLDIYLNHTMASELPISAYALAIDGRTLCVYTAWEDTSTPADMEALRRVLESIRGQAFGERGIRIVFTLDGGWDTG